MLALFYYRKAAEKNLPEAQFQIGLMYLYPEIEEETNYPLAIDWLKKSAHQGFAQAQQKLGEIYHYGIGVDHNYHSAKYWYGLAAETDHDLAKVGLADLLVFYSGELIEQEKGLKILKNAHQKGIFEASSSLIEYYLVHADTQAAEKCYFQI